MKSAIINVALLETPNKSFSGEWRIFQNIHLSTRAEAAESQFRLYNQSHYVRFDESNSRKKAFQRIILRQHKLEIYGESR